MFITFEVIYMYVYVQAYQLLVFLDVLFLLYFIIFFKYIYSLFIIFDVSTNNGQLLYNM